MNRTIFAASWNNGLFVINGDSVRQELPEQPVRGLCAADEAMLAIVAAHKLCRRAADGRWTTLARSESPLSCILTSRDGVLVGTDDGQLLRLSDAGALEPLAGFAHAPDRERWYAGTAVIDGRIIGPPLGVRSLAATADGRTILANVHVGGISRSTDGGASWHPTVEIDWDVHEVCTHPSRPEVVAAASGAGLCLSTDHGATWTVTQEGLHAPYCAAVAFSGDDILVSAAKDHFAPSGGLYRAPLTQPDALLPVIVGESRWLESIVDTACLVTQGHTVAVIDRTGDLYWSEDGGGNWDCHPQRFRMTSSLLLD